MLLLDPLGPLWPVIGILVEALLLFLIIFIAEKRKKDKEKGKIRRFFFQNAYLMTLTSFL